MNIIAEFKVPYKKLDTFPKIIGIWLPQKDAMTCASPAGTSIDIYGIANKLAINEDIEKVPK